MNLLLKNNETNVCFLLQNLLFKDSSEDSVIKIVDFGFARMMPDKEKDDSMKTPCFTLHYAAPEVLRQAVQKGANGYDETCDWWSLGVILVSLIVKLCIKVVIMDYHSLSLTDQYSSYPVSHELELEGMCSLLLLSISEWNKT